MGDDDEGDPGKDLAELERELSVLEKVIFFGIVVLLMGIAAYMILRMLRQCLATPEYIAMQRHMDEEDGGIAGGVERKGMGDTIELVEMRGSSLSALRAARADDEPDSFILPQAY